MRAISLVLLSIAIMALLLTDADAKRRSSVQGSQAAGASRSWCATYPSRGINENCSYATFDQCWARPTYRRARAQKPEDWKFPPLLRARRKRPRRRAADERDELATLHVWMAPAWQEIIWRAAQRSLAVMCPASHDGFSVKG